MTEATSQETFIFNDGGREASGFKGKTGDCACRAIAIVTGKPYREVYNELNEEAVKERRGRRKRGFSSARSGVCKHTIRSYLEDLGLIWHPTMSIGSGCKVHLRADELPPGRLIVAVSKHLTAVIDGVIHDTHDPSRGGTRCVYGYFTPPATAEKVSQRIPPGTWQPSHPQLGLGLGIIAQDESGNFRIVRKMTPKAAASFLQGKPWPEIGPDGRVRLVRPPRLQLRGPIKTVCTPAANPKAPKREDVDA